MAHFLCNWIFPKFKTIPFEDMYKELERVFIIIWHLSWFSCGELHSYLHVPLGLSVVIYNWFILVSVLSNLSPCCSEVLQHFEENPFRENLWESQSSGGFCWVYLDLSISTSYSNCICLLCVCTLL